MFLNKNGMVKIWKYLHENGLFAAEFDTKFEHVFTKQVFLKNGASTGPKQTSVEQLEF